ncbi:MAG: hypothetical protein CUN52_06600 [Phototrophicales bacterium]|nr:MAG: hypothetical protein CUN52_06600 [Phototrophicales bacterium]
MTRRQQIFVFIGIAVSILFLWLAFRNLHPEAVLQNLGRANIPLLLIGAVWYFSAVMVISMRWGYLLKSIRAIPLPRLMPLVCIGYMGNNVYPFRSGEALRIYLLRQEHHIPFVKGATTVLIERVFDGLVMLTFILIGVNLTHVGGEVIQSVATFATPLFLIALVIFFALAMRPNLLRQLSNRIETWLPKRLAGIVDKLSEDIIGGLEGLRTPADLAMTILTSYACWMLEASVYLLVAVAFGLTPDYGLMLVVVGTVNLAGLIPASPGQLGVFEFFASQVLIGAGVESNLALTYALTIHVVIWLPVTLVGFYFLIQRGLSWRDIRHARQLENA